jgi:pimeloyl-ACP methyl ester carboxylesterase
MSGPEIAPTKDSYTTSSIVSRDGTKIGYRQLGHGAGLILVHGGMASSQSLMKLATRLANDFTVYIPDRRGRGLSGPFGEDFGIRRAIEDLQALIAATGAADVFGLSVGAIVSLETARVTPTIRRLAAYEPPFSLDSVATSSPRAWLPRYCREIDAGDLASAMVTAARGIREAPVFSRLPRPVSVSLMRLAIPAEAKDIEAGAVPLRDLIPTMQFDSRIVLETENHLEKLRDISAEVLLLGGSRSPAYLQQILDAVASAIPSAERMELAGLGHSSATNGGKFQVVAEALRRFFTS